MSRPPSGRGDVDGVRALARLAAALRQEGGLIGDALAEDAGEGDRASAPALLAGRGPRCRARRADYELVIEAIHEGYLLHYGSSRLLRDGDPDLDLLAGDRFYAHGLARLVALGDVEAVTELADVISLCAIAHAALDPELAGAAWIAGAVAVGWGSSEAHRRAKALARQADPAAAAALRRAAGARAPDAPAALLAWAPPPPGRRAGLPA